MRNNNNMSSCIFAFTTHADTHTLNDLVAQFLGIATIWQHRNNDNANSDKFVIVKF